MWLQHPDFLPKVVPQARIMTFGYDASTWGKQDDFLFEHSRQLLNKLSLCRRLDQVRIAMFQSVLVIPIYID